MRRALTHLRALVGEHLHITRREVAFVRQEGDRLDVEQFEAGVRDLKHAEVEALEKALACYRGEFLEGFYVKGAPAFEEWLLSERERLHTLAVGGLRALLVLRRERGEYRAAIATARRLLTLDPWLEEAHRELMLLLALTGRRSEALAQYESCRRLLKQELGLEPLEETTALYHRLVAWKGPSGPPGTAPLPAFPFVGRSEEHATLVRWWTSARSGEVRLALVEGEAGIGKSRLVEEVIRYAVTGGAVVLRGRCYEFGGGLPYQPIASALRGQLEDGEPWSLLPDLWWGELARLLPMLRERRPDLPPPAPDEETARQRLFEAAARYLRALAGQQPLILFLDDLQWADGATLDLLHYIIRRLEGLAFWPIATYRPEEALEEHPLVRLRRTLSREGRVRRLKLTPLSAEAVGMIARTLVGEEGGAALARFLYRESEGNPFILGEVVEALREEGALLPQAGGWQWLGRPTSAIPLGVREVVLQRVGRLEPQARRLLRLAAVVGRRFDVALLAEASGLTQTAVSRSLTAWLERRLVRPEVAASGQYDFSHDKIRAVLYEALPDVQRRQFHGQIGAALERLGGEETYALIADHYGRAGERAKALDYLILAAERALTLYAYEEALRSYDRALELAGAERATRAALHLGRGRALRFLGRYEEAQRSCEAVVETALASPSLHPLAAEAANELATLHLARRDYAEARRWSAEAGRLTEAEAESARAVLLAGEIAWERGELETARRHFDAALAVYRSLADRGGIAAALERMGRLFATWGRYEEALRYYREALSAYRVLEDRRRESLCLRSMGKALWRQGKNREAEQVFSQSLAISRRIGDREGEAEVLNGLGVVYIVQGDYGATQRAWEASAALYRELGLERRAAGAMHNLGIMYLDLGDYAGAQRHLEASLAVSRTIGSIRMEALDLGWLGKLHYRRGDYVLARQHLEAALRLDEQGGNEEWLWHRAWLGMTLQAMGEVEAAKRMLLQAVAEGEALGNDLQLRECLYALTPVHLALGEGEAALRVGRRALAMAEVEGERERMASCYALLGEIYGSGTVAEAEPPEDYFHRALALIRAEVERGAHRFSQGGILRRYGSYLLRVGREEEGCRRLRAARQIFAHLGAAGELARVERLLPGASAAC